jgi:hypothetical protein
MTLNVAAKAVLVGLLAYGAFSGAEQFEGKAFGWRLVLYPLATGLVFLASRLGRVARPYPHGADLLLTLPFLIDVAGNAFDLYDRIEWWDDANHFVNWALLSAGVGLLLIRQRLGSTVLAGLVVGFGGVSAILWELGEYVAFIRNSSELATAYTDTLGDLGLGLAGSACAAAVTFVWSRRSTPEV